MNNIYSDRNILVVGLGISGVAVANLLKGAGAGVTVTDKKTRKELLPGIRKLKKGIRVVPGYGISCKEGLKSGSFDMLVVSPGVAPDDALYRLAKKKGIPVSGELEVAYSLAPPEARIIAVTGTNGKTTTVELIRNILEAQKGRKSVAAGNIGTPLSSCLNRISGKTDVVVEVSSYQLQTAVSFHPHVSVITNITPDHLEHHKTMGNYIKAKARVFSRQAEGDFCILNADDANCAKLAAGVKCSKVMFSGKKSLKKGVFVKNNKIICDTGFTPKMEFRLSPGWVKIPGLHNLENIMAGIAAGNILGLGVSEISRQIGLFRGVEHRLEPVRTIRRVKYVNDSKATNVQSCLTAVQTFTGDIVLIMGGRDKGSPYLPLKKSIKQKVRALILLGESAPKIKKELGGLTETHTAKDVKQAVRLAFSLAKSGFTVLFSPACSSFDQFNNFEERGRAFKKWVRKLQ